MSLKGKSKNKILILIIGLIIFAHTFTPHHHHYDSIVEYSDTHNENKQTHCHAFNVVISESSDNTSLSSYHPLQHFFKALNISLKAFAVLNTNNFLKFNYTNSSYQKQVLFSNHSLRAPPSTQVC